MAKRHKKSLADMLDTGTTDETVIEQAVKTIHKVQPDSKKPDKVKIPTKRVTVDTPLNWHSELKKIVVDLDMDLRSFYLLAIKEKCERLGQPLPENSQ